MTVPALLLAYGAGNQAPSITSSATFSVVEGITTVATLTATDPNVGDTLTWSITGGADSALFTINSSTGALAFAVARDYETPADVGTNNVYDVTVQVSDGTLTASQSIAVTVTNANEAPTITSSATFSVVEGNTAIATLTATDPDAGATLTWTITGGVDSAKFSLTTGGVLTFVTAPDYETPTDSGTNNVYDVNVQVSDGTNTASQSIAVTVTDLFESGGLIWDTDYKRSGVTLTTNTLATSSSLSEGGARSTLPAEQTGLRYFEAIITGASGDDSGIGITSPDWSNTTDPGGTTNVAVAVYPLDSGVAYKNNTSQGTVISGFSSGNRVGVAYNATKVWFRKAGVGANWNGSGSDNPATNTGGIAHGLGQLIYPVCRVYQVASEVQLITNPASFLEAAPSGAVPLTRASVWSPTDRYLHVREDNTFLIASSGKTIMGIAVDFATSKAWIYNPNTGLWNTGSITAQNPANGTGGAAFTATGALFPMLSLYGTASGAMNGGSAPFHKLCPAGFTAWDTLAGSTLAVDSGNKGSNITVTSGLASNTTGAWNSIKGTSSLSSGKAYFEISVDTFDGSLGFIGGLGNSSASNANYAGSTTSQSWGIQVSNNGYGIATNAGAYIQGATTGWGSARGTIEHSTGKKYFEAVITAAGGLDQFMVGIMKNNANLGSYTGVSAESCGIQVGSGSGTIYANGSTTTNKWGTAAVGQRIDVAVDFGAQKIWFRNSATGLWNNDVIGNQNPATATGGQSIAFMAGRTFPAISFNRNSGLEIVTTNFGASAFAGTMPSGFSQWGVPELLSLDFTSAMPATVGGTSPAGYAKTSSGTLTTFVANAGRRTDLGILIEPSRTNLSPAPQAISGGSWLNSGSSITSNATTAPDGTTTAEQLLETTANTVHEVHYSFVSGQLTASGTYTISMYVKSINGRDFGIQVNNQGDTAAFWVPFTLSGSGTAGSKTDLIAGFGTVTSAIEALGSGWYRCSLTFVSLNTGCSTFFFPVASGARVYTGDVTKGVYLWNSQIEPGLYASSAISTTTTRAADAITFTVPSGVTSLLYTFDDNSTQSVSVASGSYTIPTTLNRAQIKTIVGS